MITPEQREARRQVVGSSDIAALLGEDPYRSAWSVWADKVGELEDDDSTNEALELGNEFERPLVTWAAREIGAEHVDVDVHAPHPRIAWMAANLDGVAHASDLVGIEAKFTNQGEQWGEPGTDQVPARVILQAHHQMACLGLDVVVVPVLKVDFGRATRQLYRVGRDNELVQLVESAVVDFWERCVLRREPPSDVIPMARESAVFKRIRREPGSVVPLAEDLVHQWLQAQQARLEMEKLEGALKAQVLAALGEAEAGDYGVDGHLVTYYGQASRRVDLKALEAAHPDLVEQFRTTTTTRVLRHQKRGK